MQASTLWWIFLHLFLETGAILRILSRDDRDPPARLSWIVVVLSVPFLGVALYLMFGEARIARRPRRRMRRAIAELARMPVPALQEQADAGYVNPAFARAAAANGFRPVQHNRIDMQEGSEGFIAALEADIDAATREVNIAFYIWLTDRNGTRVAEALARAARRGVMCRCLVDGLGARDFIRSDLWRDLNDAGVSTAVAFPFRWSLLQALRSRIDIRNHRKIVVIDGRISYCGSQNCADPAFEVKAAFGPWVDVMARMTGPVVWQMQYLFATDWVTHSDDRHAEKLILSRDPDALPDDGSAIAIAIGTGPELQRNVVTDVFQAVIGAARSELLITTPYYVPDSALHNAIAAAAMRGVSVTMILPRRNDSRIVAFASRSFYAGLLRAGVNLLEFDAGILHAKLVVADGSEVLIGSANMDRRSLELNYENCVLASDHGLARQLSDQIDRWKADCHPVTPEMVARWSLARRIANNLYALFAPMV